MNLMTLLLTGALIAGGLGAHAVLDNQPITNSTTAPSQSINELQAKTIALDTSKGDFFTIYEYQPLHLHNLLMNYKQKPLP